MHLTIDERSRLKSMLTTLQINTIEHYRKKKLSDTFHTELLREDAKWTFVDYKENSKFRQDNAEDSDKLYCECGRELKHQYIVQSTETGDIKKLGINHFAQHLEIPEDVAKNVHSGIQDIDRWMDDILRNTEMLGYETERQYHVLLRINDQSIHLSSVYKQIDLIRDFFELDIALPTDLSLRLEKSLLDAEKSVTTHIHKKIEAHMKKLTVGEGIYLTEYIPFFHSDDAGFNFQQREVKKYQALMSVFDSEAEFVEACDLKDQILKHFIWSHQYDYELKVKRVGECIYLINE